MPEIEEATTATTEEKRPEMPSLEKVEDPSPAKELPPPPAAWVDDVLNIIPKINYPISLEVISAIVHNAYLAHAVQPTFTILQNRPGVWQIDGDPQARKLRLSIRDFAPNLRSEKMRKRFYHAATFARREMMINSLAGVLVSSILSEKDSKGITSKHGNVRGNEVEMRGTRRQVNPIQLVWQKGSAQLNPTASARMGLWLFRAGGGWLEVDTTSSEEPVTLHDERPTTQVIRPRILLEQMYMAMKKIGEHTILESMITDIAAEFTKYNEARKKDAKRLRERRRRQKKREKKKAMAQKE